MLHFEAIEQQMLQIPQHPPSLHRSRHSGSSRRHPSKSRRSTRRTSPKRKGPMSKNWGPKNRASRTPSRSWTMTKYQSGQTQTRKATTWSPADRTKNGNDEPKDLNAPEKFPDPNMKDDIVTCHCRYTGTPNQPSIDQTLPVFPSFSSALKGRSYRAFVNITERLQYL